MSDTLELRPLSLQQFALALLADATFAATIQAMIVASVISGGLVAELSNLPMQRNGAPAGGWWIDKQGRPQRAPTINLSIPTMTNFNLTLLAMGIL
jgi:hypothetical protein